MSHVNSMSLSEQESSKQDEIKQDPNTKPQEADEGDLKAFKELEQADDGEEVLMADIQEHNDDSFSEGHPDAKEGESSEAHSHHKELSYKQQFDSFLKSLETLSDPEAKLKHTIDFMESSLSRHGSPHFKSFWEARNILLQLFKENINPALRSELWSKYTELSKEARRLKELLDEQSAFATEQIEIAIQALEKELEDSKEVLEKTYLPDFISGSATLVPNKDYYYALQVELNMLNAQAARINALRKELIRTEMRIRQKNKFFQRLSAAGDKVFPRRKELIKEISQKFMDDVDAFIQNNFGKDDMQDSLFDLREEIKALQSAAKVITLNTHSFTHTRMRLSECWDQIKQLEKERKKVRAQQKAVHKQNAQQLQVKLAEIAQGMQGEQINHAEAQKRLDEIILEMRQLDLERDDIRSLKDEVNALRKPILDKIRAEEQDRLNQSQEREKQKKQKALELKSEIESIVSSPDGFDAEGLANKKEELIQKINVLSISKSEKLDLERLLKPLKDIIADKKEKALMSLSDDDRQAIQQLKEVLKQRKERRQEIKTQIEQFRKSSGSSGLDFEQAMSFNTQLATEKERLEKINQGIKEIEDKISELEG